MCRNGDEKIMDEDQNALAEQVSGDDEDVVNGGIDTGDEEEHGVGANDSETTNADQDDPYGIKKRLGMQAKNTKGKMRQMQEHMMRMQEQIGGDSANPNNNYSNQPQYPSPGQPNPPGMSDEEKIQKAVRFALGAKEHEERQAKEAEIKSHVQKQYQRLNNEFDNASEKYDDFDDVVRGDDVPFSEHVRDALLLVENPAEVAYRLGKTNLNFKEFLDSIH